MTCYSKIPSWSYKIDPASGDMLIGKNIKKSGKHNKHAKGKQKANQTANQTVSHFVRIQESSPSRHIVFFTCQVSSCLTVLETSNQTPVKNKTSPAERLSTSGLAINASENAAKAGINI